MPIGDGSAPTNIESKTNRARPHIRFAVQVPGLLLNSALILQMGFDPIENNGID